MKVPEVLEQLLSSGRLSKSQYDEIRKRLDTDDKLVVAAFQVYDLVPDETELLDTLQKIARPSSVPTVTSKPSIDRHGTRTAFGNPAATKTKNMPRVVSTAGSVMPNYTGFAAGATMSSSLTSNPFASTTTPTFDSNSFAPLQSSASPKGSSFSLSSANSASLPSSGFASTFALSTSPFGSPTPSFATSGQAHGIAAGSFNTTYSAGATTSTKVTTNLQTAPLFASLPLRPAVDTECTNLPGSQVHINPVEGLAYSALLFQPNIVLNFNKFYRLQVLETNSGHYLWTRWGRVGERGNNKLEKFNSAVEAVAAFTKKFREKTGHEWLVAKRNIPVPKPGKYTLMDVDTIPAQPPVALRQVLPRPFSTKKKEEEEDKEKEETSEEEKETKESEEEEEESESEEDPEMERKQKKAAPRRAKASMTGTASANTVDSSDQPTWAVDGTLLVYTSPTAYGTRGEQIAAFDMDDTLITTKSGRAFAANRNDWRWLFDEVPAKLRSLWASGYKVVIFTNQAGIAKGKMNAADIRGKISDLSTELGFPLQAFVATTDDIYRKPSTAMWDLMVEQYNSGQLPDIRQSFFCGDAAGRPRNWKAGAKRDFSCSDRKFALNIGVAFHTPEEFFCNEPPAPYTLDTIDPKDWAEELDRSLLDPPNAAVSPSQEMVIMVGFPGSGKSTFCKRFFVPAGYVHVNQDTLKTRAKCLQVARTALAEGKRVVIDNTNPSPAARAEFIALAKEVGAPVRCFVMQTPLDLAKHLNMYRERSSCGLQHHVPEIGYAVYSKQFAEPTVQEGFTEIVKVNWVPQFASEKERQLFMQYT